MQGNGNEAQLMKSRVARVNSEKSWDLFITQATNQGCPVVVHFTAAWCMPSVAMNHFFEELASTYQDILFLSVDVDEAKYGKNCGATEVPCHNCIQSLDLNGSHPFKWIQRLDAFVARYHNYTITGPNTVVASKMEIKAMPTFILMKEGALVDKLVGANPQAIRKMINGFIHSVRLHKN